MPLYRALPARQNPEPEADAYAAEALIPETEWHKARLVDGPTPQAAKELAQKLTRHPAIIVGRLQRELNNYKLLAKSPGVGRRTVRKQFEDFRSFEIRQK